MLVHEPPDIVAPGLGIAAVHEANTPSSRRLPSVGRRACQYLRRLAPELTQRGSQRRTVRPSSEQQMTETPPILPPDIRVLAEVLADVLAERGLVVAASGQAARVLSAAEVAQLLGRDRHWVYAHADELGAFRYGDGPRARLGFDRERVERWKHQRRLHDEPQPVNRRRSPSAPKAPGAKLIEFEPREDMPNARAAG